MKRDEHGRFVKEPEPPQRGFWTKYRPNLIVGAILIEAVLLVFGLTQRAQLLSHQPQPTPIQLVPIRQTPLIASPLPTLLPNPSLHILILYPKKPPHHKHHSHFVCQGGVPVGRDGCAPKVPNPLEATIKAEE